MRSDETVLINRLSGREEYFYVAAQMLNRDLRQIFLMQRSSSLVLGPEDGWPGEQVFYSRLLDKLREGLVLRHIVSLEGIVGHLERHPDGFPRMMEALPPPGADPRVAVVKGERVNFLKRLPDADSNPEIKTDRQARVLLTEPEEGEVEGLLVVGLGPLQTFFHLRGPKIAEFLFECLAFYDACPNLFWADLTQAVGSPS